jgi:hypothetical protein
MQVFEGNAAAPGCEWAGAVRLADGALSALTVAGEGPAEQPPQHQDQAAGAGAPAPEAPPEAGPGTHQEPEQAQQEAQAEAVVADAARQQVEGGGASSCELPRRADVVVLDLLDYR